MRLLALPLLLLLGACASTPVAPPVPESEASRPLPSQSPAFPSGASIANPTESGFQAYLEDLGARARAQGISDATWQRTMRGVHLNMKSISLSGGASGGMGRISKYLERVTPAQIQRGQARMAENAALLRRVERETGVDPAAIASIWGNETSYGSVLGTFYVPEALASLAYEGRRRAFFEAELMASLQLMQRGLITREELVGSYAGALGQVQFMPSNILKLGVDGDGDGERDIRNSLADAFASCANYLKAHGWRPGQPWLAEARLPSGFRWETAGPDITKSAAEWDAMGVRTVSGAKLSSLVPAGAPVSILLPMGYRGIALIAFENYRRFLDYNPSQSYAVAVGHWANRLKGGGSFAGSWPESGGMTASDLEDLQSALQRLGYDLKPDGRYGDRTRAAIRAYQVSRGLPADGYPTPALLQRLRAEGVS
ncbi:MAG: lytic murein transglycosylase [Alphaproteobacteria bacterium]|nr:lytic murein transglycosylase [Alphaproteobacteria bacterium]